MLFSFLFDNSAHLVEASQTLLGFLAITTSYTSELVTSSFFKIEIATGGLTMQ